MTESVSVCDNFGRIAVCALNDLLSRGGAGRSNGGNDFGEIVSGSRFAGILYGISANRASKKLISCNGAGRSNYFRVSGIIVMFAGSDGKSSLNVSASGTFFNLGSVFSAGSSDLGFNSVSMSRNCSGEIIRNDFSAERASMLLVSLYGAGSGNGGSFAVSVSYFFENNGMFISANGTNLYFVSERAASRCNFAVGYICMISGSGITGNGDNFFTDGTLFNGVSCCSASSGNGLVYSVIMSGSRDYFVSENYVAHGAFNDFKAVFYARCGRSGSFLSVSGCFRSGAFLGETAVLTRISGISAFGASSSHDYAFSELMFCLRRSSHVRISAIRTRIGDETTGLTGCGIGRSLDVRMGTFLIAGRKRDTRYAHDNQSQQSDQQS